MLFGYLISKRFMVKLANHNGPSELHLLAQAGCGEKLDITVFTPAGVNWVDNTVNGLVFNSRAGTWKPGYAPFPEVIYDRATFGRRKKEKLLAKQVRRRLKEEFHIPFLNSVNSFDKWKTHQVLALYPEISKHLPDTRLYRVPKDLAGFLAGYGTVYIKPCGGSLGRNVFRVKQAHAGKYLFSHREMGKNVNELLTLQEFHLKYIKGKLNGKKIVIQQGVNLASLEGLPFDIRVRLQKNGTGKWEIVAEIIRLAARGSVVTNISSGGRDEKFETVVPRVFPGKTAQIGEEISTLAYDACNRLEENFGLQSDLGFDIALDANGKPWLLEVNAKPANGPVKVVDGKYAYNRFINAVRYGKYLLSL